MEEENMDREGKWSKEEELGEGREEKEVRGK